MTEEMAGPPRRGRRAKDAGTSGKLRIGDDWNAITIIALSQDNPLKAVAEFVENSIDAGARSIAITRGRERGEHFLEIADDGRGVPQDADGVPDFRYVATHICDSIKRRLKTEGARGIQGEFGIGLLSFWTVGEELAMSSAGADGRVHEMRMRKGDPGYTVARRGALVAEAGTRLKIRPLLAGVRQLSGEKIQRYLASELRERIRQSGAKIRVLDRQARKELAVEPRQFSGELLHHLPAPVAPQGEIYVELYLAAPDAANDVGLYRSGTRILGSLGALDVLRRPPWTSGVLQGIVDAPFLNLTPATRTGVIHDAALEALLQALVPLEARLLELLDERKRVEEERSSRDTMRSIQRAFREAMLGLPAEDYHWFDVAGQKRTAPGSAVPAVDGGEAIEGAPIPELEEAGQRQFFEFAGPLHSVRIAPAACTLAVGASRTLRAVARDASRRAVEEGVEYAWRLIDGTGRLEDGASEFATFHAAEEPGLVHVGVTARQAETVCQAVALMTVTDSLLPEEAREPAGGAKGLKLRYLVRLYAKEMVRRNFPELRGEELLDRLIELSLYAEEQLR